MADWIDSNFLELAETCPPDRFYQNMASWHQAKRGAVSIENIAVAVATVGAFMAGGWPLAIAAGAVGASFISWKVIDSHEAIQEIESGDPNKIVAWLPEQDQEKYRAIAALPPADSEPSPAPQELPLDAAQPIAAHDSPSVVPAAPAAPKTTDYGTDTAKAIAAFDPIRSCLFLGASRSGKSLLASRAANYIKDSRGSEVELWSISAKCDRRESGYWSKFDRISFYDFLYGDDSLKQDAIAEWSQILYDFRRLRKPSILLVDELQAIGAYCLGQPKDSAAHKFWQRFLGYAVALSSMGASSNKGLWGIAPSGAMNALGMTRTIAGAFTSVFNGQTRRANPGWNETIWLSAKNNGLAPTAPPSGDDEAIAHSKGTDLLTGLNGRWVPTMRYPAPPPCDAIAEQFHTSDSSIADEDNPFTVAFTAAPLKQQPAPQTDSNPTQGYAEAIVKYARRRGEWLTARDVKNNVTAIKNSGLTTDQVRAIFTKLSERNIGTVDGDGDRLRYRLLTGVDV